MKRCPKCTTQNTTTSIYCELCGANLDVSLTNVDWFDPTATSARNIPPPPPPSALNPYPTTEFSDPYLTPDTINPYSTILHFDQSDFTTKSQASKAAKGIIRVINMVISSILFLIGTTCITLGSFGTFEPTNDPLASLCLFFSPLINIVILIITLIIILRRARAPRLRWWQRLLWVGAIFVGSIVAFIILAIVTTIPKNFVLSDALTEQILGPVFLLSGIAIEFIAFR